MAAHPKVWTHVHRFFMENWENPEFPGLMHGGTVTVDAIYYWMNDDETYPNLDRKQIAGVLNNGYKETRMKYLEKVEDSTNTYRFRWSPKYKGPSAASEPAVPAAPAKPARQATEPVTTLSGEVLRTVRVLAVGEEAEIVQEIETGRLLRQVEMKP